ncbi:MAG: tryptophan synthase subunit alpha [Chloroflexi bacterium]|nr:tryptophan synthase subunit alpha [Chloroflexota bacterium]
MTKRLDDAFKRARQEKRTGLVPYVTVGFPTSVDDTLAIVPAIEAAGATVVELGVPYSDPLGDGPTIQAASYRAVQAGVDARACIEVVVRLREAGVKLPLIFMGYYNPILSYGIDAYARDCADAGLDGMIVLDLPPEESSAMRDALESHELALIALLAPNSSDERIELGTRGAKGFVYCVSVTGVTGARKELSKDLPAFVGRVRARTDLPIAVGFGVSERRHVEAIGKYADAAAVGSALIDLIDSAPPSERAARAGAFVAALAGTRR